MILLVFNVLRGLLWVQFFKNVSMSLHDKFDEEWLNFPQLLTLYVVVSMCVAKKTPV